MAETEAPKSKRDLFMERLKGKYPGEQFDDDEALFGRISDDYDQYDNDLAGYSEREGKFSKMFTSDPRSARLMMAWKDGDDPAIALVRLYGQDIKDAIDDPDKQEAIAEANKEYMERVAQEEQYEKEYAENLARSLSELKGLKEELELNKLELIAETTQRTNLDKELQKTPFVTDISFSPGQIPPKMTLTKTAPSSGVTSKETKDFVGHANETTAGLMSPTHVRDLEKAKQDITSHGQTIGTHTEQLTKAQERLTAAEGKISEAKVRLDGHDTAIEAIRKNTDTMQGEIDDNAEDISQLQQDYRKVKETADKNYGEIGDLHNASANNSSAIRAMEIRQTVDEQNMQRIDDRLQDVAELADDLKGITDAHGRDIASIREGYARKDGAYEGMLVGSAMNLQGRTDTPNSSAYRPSGGAADIATGLAEVMAIQGNAIAWNQLVKNGNFADGIEGWDIRNPLSNDASVKNNVVTLRLKEDLFSTYHGLSSPPFSLVLGHKYYRTAEVKFSDSINSNFSFCFLNTGYHRVLGHSVNPSNVWQRLRDIVECNSEAVEYPTQRLSIMAVNTSYYDESSEIVEWSAKNFMLFDLTLIYGAGNEPATPEQFEEDYQRWFGKPLTYEEYNEGSIRDVKAQGIKTVGFNLYGGENFEGNASEWRDKITFVNKCGYKGQIYVQGEFETVPTNEEKPVTARFRFHYTDGTTSTNYLPSYINKSYSVAYLSEEGKIVDYIDGMYGNFGNLKVSNICISFSHSGQRDGEYEPHWEQNHPMDVTALKGKLRGEGQSVKVFPDGMKRAGSVFDEIRIEGTTVKAIKRIKGINLGSLTFKYSASYNAFYNTEDIVDSAPHSGLVEENQLNSKGYYSCKLMSLSTPDKALTLNSGQHKVNSLYIKDESFGNDAAAFKAAMAGVMLYYELAEPEEYVLDEQDFLPLPYKVDDWGTEQIVSPEGCVAPTLITRYGVNAVDTIRRLPQQYIGENSMTAFLASLSAAMGGTWVKTWNEAKSAYDFSFLKATELDNGADGAAPVPLPVSGEPVATASPEEESEPGQTTE